MVDIELILVVVEFALLAFTIALLLLSGREWRGRVKLLNTLVATARVLTRQEYFSMVKEALDSAQESVHAVVTGSSPNDVDRPLVDGVLKAMSAAKRNGVKMSYLLPKSPETLEMGSRLRNAGAEVRYNEGLIVSDLRYMLVDGKYTAVGLPETTGESQPTRRGVLMKSETLTSLLMEHFNRLWTSGEDYRSYLTYVIMNLVEENNMLSPETISCQLKVDASEVREIIRLKK